MRDHYAGMIISVEFIHRVLDDQDSTPLIGWLRTHLRCIEWWLMLGML